MTVQELIEKAQSLKNSKFNEGEQILFCVDYAIFGLSSIHRKLYSTAEKALEFANSLSENDYKQIYPVFDIWHNPKQVDC